MKKGSIFAHPRTGRTLLGTLTLVLSVALSVATAEAALIGQAGNAIIRNTVTVNFDNVSGVPQTAVTDTIDVSINTVNSAPFVKSFAPASGATTTTGDTQAYTVTFVTTSNGPGSVTWSASEVIGDATNMTSLGAAPAFTTGSGFLGATILDPTQTLGSTTFTNAGANVVLDVPNDGGLTLDTAVTGGATGDNVLNGIAVNDIVYLYDGTNYHGPFDVKAVTDPAVGAGATAAPGSIALQNNTGTDITVTLTAGWAIVEAKTDTLTVEQGVITNTALAADWDTVVTALMGAASGTATVTTSASQANLAVVKYVRNTIPMVGTTSLTYNTQTYYASGISGKPGDTLEYLIVITNAGTANVTDVVVTDSIPEYTTYVAGSLKVDTDGSGTPDVTISAGGETGGADTDAGIILTNTGGDTTAVASFTVYAGTGGDDDATGTNPLTGGTITGGTSKTSVVLYQVTID